EVGDLAASLVDGRYTEQKHRLVNSGLKATYLIEGDATKIADNMHYLRISPKHIAGAIVSTQVRRSSAPGRAAPALSIRTPDLLTTASPCTLLLPHHGGLADH
ncbi:MAG: hypothetical protein EOO41_03925, partial [Methanobacteriota archaeon]